MFKLKVDSEIYLCLEHESFAKQYLELVQENYDFLSQWLPWPEKCTTEDDFKSFIKGSLINYANGSGMTCAIEYKKKIVGNIGLNGINHQLKKGNIGYWISESDQGCGIVTRSCHFLINYAFSQLSLEKIQIQAAEGNLPSRAVCERLGMKLEGIITNNEIVGSKILDHAVYAIHKSET